MTMQRAYFPPGNEPGKDRAAFSGHDGTRPTPISDHIEGAKAALESGDVKSARFYVNMAIKQLTREGHAIGMPTEDPAAKALSEAQHYIEHALDEQRLMARTSPQMIALAQDALWRATQG
jgi:hypothetical protein